MANKKASFQMDWMDPAVNQEWSEWLRPVEKDSNREFCKICNKSFSLSNMGRQAVISHMGYSKHVKQKQLLESNTGISTFFTGRCTTSAQVGTSTTSASASTLASAASSQQEVNLLSPNVSIASSSGSLLVVGKSASTLLNPFMIKERTTKAEIIWALKCVMSKFSFSSCDKIQECFALMFPDSEIVKQFQLGRTKVSYLLSFGIAPYFTEQLFRSVQQCSTIVICFDEAFNKISQKCQMDLIARF